MNNNFLDNFISSALKEDIGDGDHTSLACIPPDTTGKAQLLIKEDGILAGIDLTREILLKIDPGIHFYKFIEDGTPVKEGDTAFQITGSVHSILKSERLILNILQRMSGIATRTRAYVDRLKGLKTRVLDTRKTTPCFRFFEKKAVVIGGGENHRMGLFDMIIIKDNHIDFAGGIEKAILNTQQYVSKIKKDIKIEIEARSIDSVREILAVGGVDRIMLDNFTIENTREAVELIAGRIETESSGGIILENIRAYAECGVDYISVGTLTHHIKSINMSLKAIY
ncbi:MAG: carboxylating nicotinate-nucleotide diphosphorylase [Bacteroidales bacterium]|nr:MAG: carboxylating nicotinate-nucleotide diphosphorylase [Bacteroidales bacterium]